MYVNIKKTAQFVKIQAKRMNITEAKTVICFSYFAP